MAREGALEQSQRDGRETAKPCIVMGTGPIGTRTQADAAGRAEPAGVTATAGSRLPALDGMGRRVGAVFVRIRMRPSPFHEKAPGIILTDVS